MKRRDFLSLSTLSLLGFPRILRAGVLPGLPASKPEDLLVAGGRAWRRLAAMGDRISASGALFGANADFTATFPLDAERLLLWVNHEFPLEPEQFRRRYGRIAEGKDHREAMGASVLELRRSREGGWELDPDSKRAWRLSGNGPGTRVTGPALSILGERASGTLGNCGGGQTPWGTVLTCEENFQYHVQDRTGVPDGRIGQKGSDAEGGAFNIPDLRSEEVGWVVEADPRDPGWEPRRHSALGRMHHESAICVARPGQPLCVYMTEDRRAGGIWRYSSHRKWQPKMGRDPGSRLLEEGGLEVARLLPDGTGKWIPLTMGTPLDPEAARGIQLHGEAWGIDPRLLEKLRNLRLLGDYYQSEGALYVDAWVAGLLIGGSALGGPEGAVQIGEDLFVAITGSTKMEASDPLAPPVDVPEGNILKLREEGEGFTWQTHSNAGELFANPDNLGMDPEGALLLCTDAKRVDPYGHNSLCRYENGNWERLLIAPPEAELCGPSFAHDRTMFCSVQHPAERWGESAVICVW